MQITVTITTWRVPFDQVVADQVTFGGPDAAKRARDYINDQSAQWWAHNDGARCLVEMPETDDYGPINELGYNHARYELWGGECGFHAMIDRASYAALHEAHYKREFDDKGLSRPGYLVAAEAFGHSPK